MAFFLLVPIVVMTLIYYALLEDEKAKLGVVTRGVARFYEYPLVSVIEEDEDIEIVSLDIPDKETDPAELDRLIMEEMKKGKAHGILYMDQQLLSERFAGERGAIHIYLEGSRPTSTAAIFSSIAEAMDDLTETMPVVIDAECSAKCANSVNIKAIEIKKHYLYGSEDYRLIDYFLPVFPTFFVFFFTFIISTITFQRERVRGTLERLLIAPVSFSQIILGYISGFIIFSSVQALIIIGYILALIQISFTPHQLFALGVTLFLIMIVALTMGLLASFMAMNEFQAIQFIPLVILPQIFLSDMIWRIESFPLVFQWISYGLPLTHANIISRKVMLQNQSLWENWPQLLSLGGFFLFFMLVMSLVALKRNKNN